MEVHVVQENIMRRKKFYISIGIFLLALVILNVRIYQPEENQSPTVAFIYENTATCSPTTTITPMLVATKAEVDLDVPVPWKCDGKMGTTLPDDNQYYATSFGCWRHKDGTLRMDNQDGCNPGCYWQAVESGLCNSDMSGAVCEANIKYFTAGDTRWPCLTRLRVTDPNSGKSVIAVVLDGGPACWVENNVGKAVLDISVPVSLHLFGESTGWSEKILVDAYAVNSDIPLGPTEDMQVTKPVEPDVIGTAYVMNSSIRNGVNVRSAPTLDSTLKYMLEKIDGSHPVIDITKNKEGWGYMETGVPEKSGWVYLQYLDVVDVPETEPKTVKVESNNDPVTNFVPTTTQSYHYVKYWDEVMRFIQTDKTNDNPYIFGTYGCEQFAMDLMNNLRSSGIYAYRVVLKFNDSDDGGHIIVAIPTTDLGVVFIEPQDDFLLEPPRIGQPFCYNLDVYNDPIACNYSKTISKVVDYK